MAPKKEQNYYSQIMFTFFSFYQEETTGQLQPIPHFNLPNTIAQLLQEAPDPGVRNPAIMKKLQDKISRNKGKPRVSGSVMPVPRMAPGDLTNI